MANRYESRSGKRTTYGNGSKTNSYLSGPSYSSTRNPKSDTYFGGRGKPDGPGHGHKVKAGGMTTYSRPASKGGKRPQGASLGDLLFGKPSKKPWWK